jgi:hypothetical protein
MAWNLMELHQIGISPEMGRWPLKEKRSEPDFSGLACGDMD